jgi:hypothetical protein
MMRNGDTFSTMSIVIHLDLQSSLNDILAYVYTLYMCPLNIQCNFSMVPVLLVMLWVIVVRLPLVRMVFPQELPRLGGQRAHGSPVIRSHGDQGSSGLHPPGLPPPATPCGQQIAYTPVMEEIPLYRRNLNLFGRMVICLLWIMSLDVCILRLQH